jgi:hypothetical protein
MAIRIPIISDFDSKGLDKAVKQFQQLETSGEKAQFALRKAAAPAALALTALGGAAVFATKAAIDDATAQAQLAGVLERQTGATQAQIAATEQFISSMSATVAIADDQLRPALSALVTATGDLAVSQDLLNAAADLAAATNSDLATATDALSKAYNGNLKGLQALDPSLRGAIKDGATFEQIMATLAQTTGGAAAAAANTTAGRFKALQIRFGELQEEIGAKLLPVAEKLIGGLSRVLGFVERNVDVIVPLAGAVGVFAVAIIAANAAMSIYATLTAAATAANTLFAASLTATGIGAIVVAIGLVVAGFTTLIIKTGGVTNAFKTMGNFVILVMEQFVNNTIIGLNLLIKGLNKMIDGLQAVGINVKNVGQIAPVTFKRMAIDANAAADAVSRIDQEAKNAANRLAQAQLQTGLVTLAQAQKNLADATARVNQIRGSTVISIENLNNALKDQQTAQETLNLLLGETSVKTAGVKRETESYAQKLKEALTDALDGAKDRLKAAQAAFDEFSQSVSVGVRAGLSFAAAYQLMQAASKNAAEASQDVKDAQAELAKAVTAGKIDEIAEAQKKLTEAQKADAIAAAENKETFLGRIKAQVEGVKEYANNLKTLLERGLSQDALKMVLGAGAEAGSAIARELVAGTTDTITGPQGINAMVAAAQTAADAVGLDAASRWYQSGIDQATQIVEGIDAALQAMTPRLMARMDKIAASLKRTVDVTVRITEHVTRIIGGGPVGAIPKLADGGIVTRPTLALIGERGPEAVVPLNRGTSMGGGITVNVNGGLATSAEIGQAIVNALRAYNRSAGPINVAVA